MCGDLKYGCNYYDYHEGTLVFISPGQIVEVENFGENFQPKGYALMFHPELIYGTALARLMQDYTFFGYQSNEALLYRNAKGKLCWIVFQKFNMN